MVYRSGLENRRAFAPRGFESHPLRQQSQVRGADHAEAQATTATRKVAIELLGPVFLLMWLAIVSNAQPIVLIPY